MKKVFLSKILLVITLLLTTVGFATQVEAEEERLKYEFYPQTQELTYKDKGNDISSISSYVISENLDESTLNHLLSVVTTLKDKESLDSNKKQVLVSIKGDADALEEYVLAEYAVNEDIFTEHDAYYLNTEENIVIYAKDTDAAYYAITTLGQMLDQSPKGTIEALIMSDYSNTALRGFIEGFYGVPWSNEDRMELMRFGGKHKMNAYLFAPKDDPYHNEQWRVPYPADKIAEIEEMVQVGVETKNRFIWTIHPFMNDGVRYDEANYTNDLNTIITKFEQLYAAGVRQFGVLADDVDQSAMNPDNQLKLMNDIHAWNEDKGDNYDLIFVPSVYNNAWVSSNRNYFTVMNRLPQNIHVMWTGDSVLGSVNQGTVDRFQNLMPGVGGNPAREPFFWLNWPVNDINSRRLTLGKSEMVQNGVKNLDGVVANPMQQAEASKGALFTIADYTWNTENFNLDKNWEDSFKYIEGKTPDSLRTIAKHLNDPSPNGHGVIYKESEEISAKLSAYQTSLGNGTVSVEKTDELIAEFQTILDATIDLKENAENRRYIAEVEPWINSLKDLAEATIAYLNTEKAVLVNDVDSVWANFSVGLALEESSKNQIVINKGGPERVESGAKRLVPFMIALNKHLSPIVDEALRPEIAPSDKDEVTLSPTIIKSEDMQKIYQGNENNVFNSNDSQHVWYQTKEGRLTDGAYFGLDLGKEVYLGEILFKQGTTGNTDMFTDAYLEVSLDGEKWDRISGPYNSKHIEMNIGSKNIRARYVRFVNTVPNQIWYAVREFKVTGFDVNQKVYTNIEEQKAVKFSVADDSFDLEINQPITVGPGQYIGLDLERIRDIQSITTNDDLKGLELRVSNNPVEFKLVDAGTLSDETGRYVIVKNKTDQAITLDNLAIGVKTKEFFPMTVSDTNIANLQNVGALFDKNLSTKATSTSKQTKDQYFIADLGQKVNLDTLRFVISDTEENYIENAEISVSSDGTTYTKVGTLGTGTTGTAVEVYPDKDVAYLSKIIADINQGARYVKVEITETPATDKTIVLNEIQINGGEYIRSINNPSFELSPSEEENHSPELMLDNDFNTYFLPKTQSGAGKLTYHVSSDNMMNEIIVLQSANNISNTKVSVRTATGWENIGKLDSTYNILKLDKSKEVFTIQFDWTNGNMPPAIYELYTNIGLEKEALIQEIDKAELLLEEDFTPATWDAMQTVLKNAKAMAIGNKGKQTEVDALVVELQEAIANLIERADKKALSGSIDSVKDLNEEDYAVVSWSNFNKALTEAKRLEKDHNATQSDVDQAKVDLDIKKEALVNLVEMNQRLEDVKAFDRYDYVQESWDTFNVYLRELKTTLKGSELTQADVTKLLEELNVNISELERIPEVLDFEGINDAIEQFDALNKEDFTPTSFKEYEAKVNEAKALLELDNLSQDMLDEAVKAITDSFEALIKSDLDLTALNALNSEIEKLDEQSYTEASWNKLMAAQSAAQDYAKLDTVVQSELNSLVEAANNALGRLIEDNSFATDLLVDTLQEARLVDEKGFSKASIKVLNAAIEEANTVLDQLLEEDYQGMTQIIIDETTATLRAAIDGLVTSIPATPLEPSTPIEKEEIPWTPLEPSKPIEKDETPWTPLEPSSPIKPTVPAEPNTPDKGDNDLPATGQSNNQMLIALGLVSLGSALVLYFLKTKNEENEA